VMYLVTIKSQRHQEPVAHRSSSNRLLCSGIQRVAQNHPEEPVSEQEYDWRA
jgi:hypothetical protein